ncbi:MAG: ABC transporter ATP-binding protein [Chloroflexi bacterium]|nr:ABC transporter ATP-binding protein [Chloroflexota bacterium]
MNVIARILATLVFRPYFRRVLLGYVSVLGSAAFAIAIPRILGVSINRMVDPGSAGVSPLYSLALILVLAGAARGLFSLGQTYLGESLSQKVAFDIRNAYFAKLQSLSFAFHDRQNTGALMSRATADVEGIRMFVNMGAIRAGFILAMVGGIAVAMVVTDLKLALVSLSFVPLLAWQAIVTSRTLRRTWLRVQELTGDMVTVLQENLSGIRVVKAFGAEEHEKRRFGEGAARVREETFLAESRWARGFATMNGGFMAATAAILWFGGQEVIDGRTVNATGDVVYAGLTPGDLAAFVIYMGLLTMPVRMMGWMVNNFARAASCGERLFEILDMESPVRDADGARPLANVRGRVSFENVSFGYDDDDPVLRGVTVDIPAGSTVALIGRPGSGKTTFAHLIPRFYDVTSGRVLIDGVDVRDATLASVRASVGIVQQDVFIHTATIHENVIYGAVDASLSRVVKAATAAQLHDFIAGLPDGYDSIVGERGVGLSGGQKQRLSIARTMLTNPPVLILDDSTSSVDAQTERSLHQALNAVIAGRTTFIITNRLSTVRNADVVLVFKDGAIVERGRHEELLAMDGEYRILHDSQLRPLEELDVEVTRAVVGQSGGSE